MTPTELIMLGCGYALAIRNYNACFALRTESGCLLVDAGGGNGILRQLQRAGIAPGDLSGMFLTHAHTDHLLGALWVLRLIGHEMQQGKYEGRFCIRGCDRTIRILDRISRMTLPRRVQALMDNRIELIEMGDGATFDCAGMRIQCFDTGSTKEKQYGFRAQLPDGQQLVCLGDEPYREQNRPYVAGADWLIHEAFCLERDRERFRPEDKGHGTVREAAHTAARLGVRNLILYHTEEESLERRKAEYTAEAAREFSGGVYVPDDLEHIMLHFNKNSITK